MEEKIKNSQEKEDTLFSKITKPTQDEELQNTLSNKEMDETEMLVKNGTATSEWRDFWKQAQKRRDEELLNSRLEEIMKMRPDVEYTETDKEALKILLKQMITEAHTLKVMEKMYKKSKTK
ncbi:MAG: hypothetical protein IKW05_05245 [Muribaculaceae bacterium]|nr:hypothetical protein [Muribaculaceae bacterium]